MDGFRQLIASRPYPLSLPITQVILIRDVLELLGDAPMLLEMILAISNVDDCEILTLVANTICYNLEVFSVLHSPAKDLTQRLYLKYKHIYTHQLQTSKEFLISLLDLCTLAGVEAPIRTELSNHLSTYDQRHPRTLQPIGGCSPISEPLDDDIFDDNDLENNEEIDRLWNTGAKVDKQDLSRLFETTVSKLETSFEDTDNASHLLSASKELLQPFTSLQGFLFHDCFFLSQIETLVNVTLQIHSQYKASSISALDAGLFVTHTLSLLLCSDPFSTPLSAASSYSLKLKRTLFITRSHAALLNLFRVAFQMSTASGDPILSTQLRTLLPAPSSLDTLHLIATHNLPMLQTEIITPLLKQKQCLPSLLMLIDYLLADPEGGGEADSHVQVARLLDLADDFSIRICKLKLQIILTQEAKDDVKEGKDGKMKNRNIIPGNTTGNASAAGSNPTTAATTTNNNVTGAGSNTIARALLRGFTLATPERRIICKDLLSVLDQQCAAKIRQDVEELFWDEENFLRTRNLAARLEVQMTEGMGDAIARAFLAVVEATAGANLVGASNAGSSSGIASNGAGATASSSNNGGIDTPPPLLDHLTRFLSHLTPNNHDDPIPPSEFRTWFTLFTRLLSLHRPAFISRSPSSDQARLLAGLCSLLSHDLIRNDESIHEALISSAGAWSEVAGTAWLLGAAETELKAVVAKAVVKQVEFGVKPWEKLAEPTPVMGENDGCLSLTLFRARKF
ncbi:hypothetical protein BZA77DRAFT_363152 [Pyronema omphalodes]|nr:hypothetical protein BZA77DRAFT_363152 [Pyronema omphalodes]